jgi:hypothetical protein
MSVTALVNASEAFNGVAIRVWGFLHADSDGITLFTTSEHCENLTDRHGIRVSVDTIQPEVALSQSNMGACVMADVHGTFSIGPYPARSTGSVMGDLYARRVIEARYLRLR